LKALRLACLRLLRTCAAGAPAAVLVCAVGAANAEDTTPISRAETLLFMTPHLEEVKPPARLHYTFLKTGTLEKGFSDTVDIDITAEASGGKKGSTNFFSGEHKIHYPEVEHVQGNPVLLFYLEREIREMSRLTGGVAEHFRRRIRTALAESARIKNVDIQFQGRTLKAQQIEISPYVTDPNRPKFDRLADKEYFFVLCDEIPGDVYELRGLVRAPNGSSSDEPVVDETLKFSSAGAPK